MKMAVLKPIMWNNKGYRRPGGFPSTSGYSHDHGYGHEEWNNNPHWRWRGYKVFHTEGAGTLQAAAENGDLGMVMIASHDGTACALGVATNIHANTDDEMKLIADAVDVFNDWPAVWQLDTVRKCFSSQVAFLKHWRAQCRWIRWKCQPDHHYWFPQPVALDPKKVTGEKPAGNASRPIHAHNACRAARHRGRSLAEEPHGYSRLAFVWGFLADSRVADPKSDSWLEKSPPNPTPTQRANRSPLPILDRG